jgi:DNA repair exonuclease SbcCD nuclease subunit
MKFVILNDTHSGARNNSEIFINYQEDFYTNVFFPYMKTHGITHIVHLGDYYEHRKFVNFKALQANRKHFLQKLVDNGMTMDIIPGNHDVVYKNTNELCSLKELMGHYMNNVNIVMKPTVMDYDGLKFGLIPWINNENYAETMKFVKNCTADMIGGHFEFEGFEMHKGAMNTHGMSTKEFGRFELVLSGHFHTKSHKGNIHYLGSQMEFNWGDCDDTKYFHVIDTTDRSLTPVANPLTMFTKIIYNDDKNEYNDYNVDALENKFVKVVVVKKTNLYAFDRFIDRIQQVNTHELKIAETFEEFLGDSVDDAKISVEDTTELLDTYVQAVETDLDKDRLKTIMRTLYVEAQNVSIV